MAHRRRRAAEDRDFEAMACAEVDVQTRHDQIVMVMLLLDQPGCQLASVMVVNESKHGDLFSRAGLRRLFVNEAVADEVTDRLAARGIPLARVAAVERVQQGGLERDADASEVSH